MNIQLHDNINAKGCATCARHEPWDMTIARIEAQLRAHGVTWPDFVIIHGNYRSCDAAKKASGRFDAGLYLVATDAQGKRSRTADLFDRKDPSYVGLKSIFNGTAFRKKKK